MVLSLHYQAAWTNVKNNPPPPPLRTNASSFTHQVVDVAGLKSIEVASALVAGHLSVVGQRGNVHLSEAELRCSAAFDGVTEYKRALEHPVHSAFRGTREFCFVRARFCF